MMKGRRNPMVLQPLEMLVGKLGVRDESSTMMTLADGRLMLKYESLASILIPYQRRLQNVSKGTTKCK
jgi:hypothetical protein